MVQKRFQMRDINGVMDAIALVSQGQPGHIVDELIAERGQGLVNHPLWPVMRPFSGSIYRVSPMARRSPRLPCPSRTQARTSQRCKHPLDSMATTTC